MLQESVQLLLLLLLMQVLPLSVLLVLLVLLFGVWVRAGVGVLGLQGLVLACVLAPLLGGAGKGKGAWEGKGGGVVTRHEQGLCVSG